MDPSYTPYAQQQQPLLYPPSAGNGPNGQIGPGIPAHPGYPQYQHGPYGPPGSGYPYNGQPPSYSPSGVLIYPSGRSGPEPPKGGSDKRKRKSTGGSIGRARDGEFTSDEDTASGSDARNHQRQVLDAKKRTKTQRACDSCRSRKIRCDVLIETDPPLCQHCKQYGFECTFFLPITETRFKKKRLEEEAAERAAEVERRSTSSPRGDPSIMGPTSPTHLLHSTATISSRIYEQWDKRYHHSFEVSENGDGLVVTPRGMSTPAEEHSHAPPKSLELRLERDLLERLVNSYFTDLSPLLPVVTKAEFIAFGSPPPILLYSMCLVAAARRDVPQSVFDSLRHAVNHLIKQDDVLSTASVVHVQALLILCMMADVHSPFVPQALSCLWIRLGAAIRMAQDLGLHRAESVKQDIELRRRLWGICVVSDRWISLAYGHPFMIDVQDCDARLPSSGTPSDLYLDQLVRLSLILGRVLKTIYSPSGLATATDDILRELLKDIVTWRERLPDSLRFRGPDTPRAAGLLHLLFSCVNMIFWRVFMRISYSCPAHLKFALTINDWSNLVELTAGSIGWLDRHDNVYDQWLLIAYAATSCALVQYHTWVRRNDKEAAENLRILRDFVRRWESSLNPDHMSARRKTAEIITLLHGATTGPPVPLDQAPLNPTAGVTTNKPFESMEFRKDPSRPGGGVFVARGVSTPDGREDPDGEEVLEDNGLPRPLSVSAPNTPNAANTSMTDTIMAPPAEPSKKATLPGNRTASMPTIPPSAAQNLITGSRVVSSPIGMMPPQGSSNLGPMMDFNPAMSFSPFSNVNPAMDDRLAEVQLMNALDAPTDGNLAQLAMADTGFLEGMPTTAMFDWVQWDSFFARFPGQDGTGGYAGFQQPPAGPMQSSPGSIYGPTGGAGPM